MNNSIHSINSIPTHELDKITGNIKFDNSSNRPMYPQLNCNGKSFNFFSGTIPENLNNQEVTFNPFYLRIPEQLTKDEPIVGTFALYRLNAENNCEFESVREKGTFGCVPKLLAFQRNDQSFEHVNYEFGNHYYLPLAAALHYNLKANKNHKITCHGVYYKTDLRGLEKINKAINEAGIENLELGIESPVMPDSKIRDIYVVEHISVVKKATQS